MSAMAAFRFSTETPPERDRLAIFIEGFSKTLFKTDVEPLPDTRFVQSATFRRLPGLSMILGSGSAVRCTRTLRHIADSVEDPYFHIHLRGTGQFTQLGRETTFAAREAVLTSGEDAATARFFQTVSKRTCDEPMRGQFCRVTTILPELRIWPSRCSVLSKSRGTETAKVNSRGRVSLQGMCHEKGVEAGHRIDHRNHDDGRHDNDCRDNDACERIAE
jgi:hypothetical protein